MKILPLGPLMIDIAGTALTAEDRARLQHPLVGGLILFTRNFVSTEQLTRLCAEIHVLRQPALPIAVDHEGGRVQRFREGFTRLPAMRRLGELYEKDQAAALDWARASGYVLASELRASNIDFSFTPVLDLDYGESSVIGDRAFHRQPEIVAELAQALSNGLKAAGMASCGKHFPGHGYVAADSHLEIPVDERSYAQMADDLAPYRRYKPDAVMPAHVIYPKVDSRPAGFSPVWLKLLREEFAFDGVIFSDDLSMEGASAVGGILERANAAWSAGCDMLLVCNSPDLVDVLLAQWQPTADPVRAARIERLRPNLQTHTSWPEIEGDANYRDCRETLRKHG